MTDVAQAQREFNESARRPIERPEIRINDAVPVFALSVLVYKKRGVLLR